MYLSNGMFYEALRNLIVNELHVPSLHVLDGKDMGMSQKPGACPNTCNME